MVKEMCVTSARGVEIPPIVFQAPTMAQKWPSFSYQTMPPMMPMSASQPPSWMDDFLDFSSARRNAHRRSASDPIAFVETPFINECRNSNSNDPSMIPCSNNNGFERLDDEQLSSMFSDDVAANLHSTRSSSSPSEQNSDNDEPRPSPPQEQPPSQLKSEPGRGGRRDGGTIVDPKRVKRILANRQSAQRSRVRKLHYISELERSVTTLQTEVSTLSPRVAFLDHQRLILNVDNSSLKQRIAALAQDKIFKDAHQEALKKEIERLRRVYHEQNMNNNNNKTDNITTGSPASMVSPPAAAASVSGTDER
ncbi:unnamed protein product [Lactuca saligna]|uniref:BZIP domain-containing protein n=1 Tax=Lactuca saligna TaxID=75948 RepID=A0AA35V687_LACSI|nr:unnamed protein product [Lactuca saligna]